MFKKILLFAICCFIPSVAVGQNALVYNVGDPTFTCIAGVPKDVTISLSWSDNRQSEIVNGEWRHPQDDKKYFTVSQYVPRVIPGVAGQPPTTEMRWVEIARTMEATGTFDGASVWENLEHHAGYDTIIRVECWVKVYGFNEIFGHTWSIPFRRHKKTWKLVCGQNPVVIPDNTGVGND